MNSLIFLCLLKAKSKNLRTKVILLYSSTNEHYIRSKVEHMDDQEKYFKVLRKIGRNDNASKRTSKRSWLQSR